MSSKTPKSEKSSFLNLKIKQEPPDPDEQPFSPASYSTESSQLSQSSQRSQKPQKSLASQKTRSSERLKTLFSDITVKSEPEPVENFSSLKKSLELNQRIKALLKHEAKRMEKLLIKNRDRQELLKMILSDEKAQLEKKPMTQIRAISVFAAPYFRDVKKMVPPPNEDTLLKRKSCDVNAYLTPPRPWTPVEHKKLLDGITAYALLAALHPLKRDKNYIKRKMKDKNATDENIEELKQELYICEEKIKLVNQKPLIELLMELGGNIDWMTVSATHMEGIRTPEECENMWNNVLSFHINKEVFNPVEDNRLSALAENYKERNWDEIALHLQTNRTAIQCFERYQTRLSYSHRRKYWTQEEDDRLVELVDEYRCGEIIPWNKISLMMEGRTRQQIINRYERSISQKYNRFPWTAEEDGLLIALYQKYGSRWNKMKDYFSRRSTYAIRERYCNALTPNIRAAPWSLEEDKLLIATIRRYGYGRWSKICRKLPGRTDNMCLMRAGRLLEWSIKYHLQNDTGEFDPSVNDPRLYGKILRPCAPAKYCPIRNERLKSYRENGLKVLVLALEKVFPERKAGLTDLHSVDVSWMSSEQLHKISEVLHANLTERFKFNEIAIPPLKYITKPTFKRRREESESDCEGTSCFWPPPVRTVPREEKKLVDSALGFMFNVHKYIMPNITKKTQNYGSRQCAEMALYKSYLYKQYQCKAVCDPEDDLEHVVFAKVDYRDTLPTVVSFFIQPPVYDNQFIVLAPNLTTMLGIETIHATENRLLSMSDCVSHSKPYVDYLCERKETCPKCLQCLQKHNSVTTSATPESVIASMKKKSFLVDKRMEDSAYIEGGSTERLSDVCSCRDLVKSQTSVQLLRKRFLSLFLWPSFFSTVEFSKDHEYNIMTKHKDDNDFLLEPVQGSKGNRQKRRSNLRRPAEKKLNLDKPLTDTNPDDPVPEPDPEPKAKRKRLQSKYASCGKKAIQSVIRKSHRSCVVKRTSFVPETLKKCKSAPNSDDGINNTSQILEENGCFTSSAMEKENLCVKNKSTPSTSKINEELPAPEATLHDMQPSAKEIESSSQLLKRKVKDTSFVSRKKKICKNSMPSPSTNNEPSVSPDMKSTEKINNSSQLLEEENRSAISFVPKKRKIRQNNKSALRTNEKPLEIGDSPELLKKNVDDASLVSKKRNVCKSRKSTSNSNEKFLVSNVVSCDVQSLAADIDNSSQLLEGKRSKPSLVAKKRNTRKNNKSESMTNAEPSVPETASCDMQISIGHSSSSSQLLEKNICEANVIPKKKNIRKNCKSTSKTNKEISVSQVVSHDVQPSAKKICSSSQLLEENICKASVLPKKKNTRKSNPSIKKSPASYVVSNGMLPLPEKMGFSSQPLEENINKSSKSTYKIKLPSFSETSHVMLSTESTNLSSQLLGENRYVTVSLTRLELNVENENVKSIPETSHESSSEITSYDILPSVDETINSSQLLEENKSESSFVPEKKNENKRSDLTQVTNNELLAKEIISHEIPAVVEICNSSQFPEDGTPVSEKKNENERSDLTQVTNNELLAKEIISHEIPTVEEICNSSQFPEDDTPSVSEKRNKRKSRKPVRKASREISELERISNNTNEPSTGEILDITLSEKRNNNKSVLLDEMMSKPLDVLKENTNDTLLDETNNQSSNVSEESINNGSPLLDETNSRSATLSKEKVSNGSSLLNKIVSKTSNVSKAIENIASKLLDENESKLSNISKKNRPSLIDKITSKESNTSDGDVNNAARLLDDIKNKPSDTSGEKVTNTVVSDETNNMPSKLLNGIGFIKEDVNQIPLLSNKDKSRESHGSKENVKDQDISRNILCSYSNGSPLLHEKEEKCMNGLIETVDKNKQTVLEQNNLDNIVFMAEKDRDNTLILKNKNEEDKSKALKLSNESINNIFLIQEENSNNKLSPKENENDSLVDSEDSVLFEENTNISLSEKNGGTFSVLQNKNDMVTPLQEVSCDSPLTFQDRSNDSILVIDDKNRNTPITEEITVYSDSSVSNDQCHNSESSNQESDALELTEKNLIT